ncbi:MAG TPA: SMI1/KNR4 family protein [Xanthomonadales bacterium]|nr:SMI1/KNR4 family protein [Xanthomonadales bacterium]
MRQASLFLAGALAAAPATAFTLHDALGDDQRSETIRVWIDDREPVVLAVDARHPHAAIELPVDGDEHRYRLEGESVSSDGLRTKLEGSGLIVTAARMDRIAERPQTASDAFAAYRRLFDALVEAAPRARLDGLDPGEPVPVSAEQVAKAEQRLGFALPRDYVRFVTEVGALRFAGDGYAAGRVFAPQELGTLADFVVAEVRENGWDHDWKQMNARIVKRYPRAGRDIVLDVFSLDEPTVLVRDHDCPDGEIAIVLPESDYQLLVPVESDNPLMGLIDYEGDIVGETRCFDYDRIFAYSLHDQLIDFGDDVLYLRDDGADAAADLERGEADVRGAVWLKLSDHGK